MFKRFALLSAAALLAALPVVAQDHDHGKMEDHKMEAGQCPHHQAVATAVDQAMALLDAAMAEKDPAAMSAKVAEARRQLGEAKGHVAQCQEMCSKMMGTEGHGMMDHGAMMNHGAPAAAGAKVKDPVCGEEIDPATAAAKSVYAGKTYYFCSPEEKVKFDKDPEAFLKKGE